MDNEKLDGLIVDYSLGAAPDDVAVLLDALAEKDADVRARIDQWRGLADLARRAGEGPAKTLPAFPRNQIVTAKRGRQARQSILWVVASAACVIIGFFGARLSQTAPTPPTERRVIAMVTQPAPVTAVADFWSLSRLRADQERRVATPNENSSTGMTWEQIRRIGG